MGERHNLKSIFNTHEGEHDRGSGQIMWLTWTIGSMSSNHLHMLLRRESRFHKQNERAVRGRSAPEMIRHLHKDEIWGRQD